MAFHHVAVATRDTQATHRFYTEATGFELVKVVAAKSPEGGWAKHLFYETGGGELMAFWELHDPSLPSPTPSAIATDLGLPVWSNHIAFHAADLADIERRKRRWLEHGHDVMEIDHDWCVSIYTVDPNGILVEFCTMTRALDENDRAEALRLLNDPHPPLESGRQDAMVLHKAQAS
ncbi:MAG: VOC family protein [Proteobacteria bacterium]|nr:MAG: VOC family protein [Pseudomonadota bacterium]